MRSVLKRTRKRVDRRIRAEKKSDEGGLLRTRVFASRLKTGSKVNESALKATGRGRYREAAAAFCGHLCARTSRLLSKTKWKRSYCNENVLDNSEGKTVVPCQALENEPLHSPFIMSAWRWLRHIWAAAICANSVADIEAIRQQVPLPVIGIIKRDYPESEVFITATMKRGG